MPVRIRSLQPDEWRTYRAVRLAALRDVPEAFGGTYADSLALTEREWRERCEQPAWFALDGAEAVGMVRTWRHPDKELPELISMWVAPVARGTSVAADLVTAVLDRTRAEGDAGVYLRVTTANDRARALYRRLGFVPNGITDTLPDGRPELEMEHRFGPA